jgi:hypothetical protein
VPSIKRCTSCTSRTITVVVFSHIDIDIYLHSW